MEIIELLIRIANGDPIPHKIKYFDKVYEWDTDYKNYVNVENGADIGLPLDESELHCVVETLETLISLNDYNEIIKTLEKCKNIPELKENAYEMESQLKRLKVWC